MRIRALVLCGLAATAVAAPAAAQLPPVPTVPPLPVPTPRLPVPTVVPTSVPTVVPTSVPTIVPTAVPTVAPPRLPSLPGGGGGGAPSGGGGSAGGSGSAGGGSGSASGGGSSGGASGSGAPSGGGSGASSGGGSGRSSGGGTPSRGGTSSGGGTRRTFSGARSRPSSHTLAVRRDRKLRAAVLARQSCLGSLSRPERLVLTLRAGVDANAPRSRGSVARRLRITIRRVTKLEHAGLKRLRAVCGVASTAATTTTDSVAPPAPGSTLAQAPAESNPTARKPSRTATPAPSTEAEEPTSGGVAGRSATNIPSPGEGGFQLWIPLFLLACGIAGYFASRLLPARAGAPPATRAGAPAATNWAAPPTGGVEPPPPAHAPVPPAPPPPADDPPPKLPEHRVPSRHRH